VRAKQCEVHEMYPKVNADVNIEISSEGLLKDIPFRYTIIDWLSTVIKLEQHSKNRKIKREDTIMAIRSIVV